MPVSLDRPLSYTCTMTERCLTSKRLRALLWIEADGKCQICGCQLDPENWHADHIIPWKDTHRTNVHEMQALCPECNRKKGSKVELHSFFSYAQGFQPRRQQIDLWSKVANIDVSQCSRMLAELCTGYGKTLTAYGAFWILYKRGLVDRLLVLVPTDEQRKQFADDINEARRLLGVDLGKAIPCEKATREFKYSSDGGGYQIIVATYQQLKEDDVFFRHLIANHRWMVVPDECHHLPESGYWATQCENLPRVFSLYLSATPIRTDRCPLRGVPEHPSVVADYPTAFKEKAVRKVQGFIEHYYVDVETDDGPTRVTTEDLQRDGITDFCDFEARKQLRYNTNYLDWMLREPLQSLAQRNIRHPRQHQMVVFAMSCKHADYITRQLNALSQTLDLGFTADWVGVGNGLGGKTKSDKENSNILDRFKNNELDILVQVDKAGEGFNVKRASVLVFLHLIGADGKLLQQIGRGIRRNPAIPWEEDDCLVYASADTPIANMIRKMVVECDGELREPISRDKTLQGPTIFNIPDLVVIDAEHERTEHVSSTGVEMALTGVDLDFIAEYNIDPAKFLEFLKKRSDQDSDSRRRYHSLSSDAVRTDREELNHQQEQVKHAATTYCQGVMNVLKYEGRKLAKNAAGKIKQNLNTRWVEISGKSHQAMEAEDFAKKHKWFQQLNDELKQTRQVPKWLVSNL